MLATGDDDRPEGAMGRLQGGFTMVEVVVAAVVLLIVLVPASGLLSNSGNFVTESKAQAEASHLASGLLEQDRASAASSSWWGAGTPPTPALADTTPTVESVGGVPFSVRQQGGWCAETNGAWGSTFTNASEVGYGVQATVTWQAGTHQVVSTTVLAVPLSIALPNSGSCPLS
jgi:Tfp pilus assembly protein PilV